MKYESSFGKKQTPRDAKPTYQSIIVKGMETQKATNI